MGSVVCYYLPMDTAYCPTCRTSRQVMDTYDTDTGDSRPTFVAYTAQALECGHDAGDGGSTPMLPSIASAHSQALLVDRVAALQESARQAGALS